MELNLQQRRKALLAKIPDIEQTLSVVKFLQARREPKAAADEKDETGSMNSDDIDALLDGDDEEDEGAEQKPLKTLFELNDTLYAEATVQETGKVGLWLGVSHPSPANGLCLPSLLEEERELTFQANTMLLYPLAEAAALLEEKLAAAKKSLKEAVEDLEWIREQVTVMEVNFARVHNVSSRRRAGQLFAADTTVGREAPPRAEEARECHGTQGRGRGEVEPARLRLECTDGRSLHYIMVDSQSHALTDGTDGPPC